MLRCSALRAPAAALLRAPAAALLRSAARRRAAAAAAAWGGRSSYSAPAAAAALAFSAAAVAGCDAADEAPERRVLGGTGDAYGGVVVAVRDVGSVAEFASRLDASLEGWRARGARGVWLEIPLSESRYAAAAADRGFAFHSAEPRVLRMTRWLPADTPSPLPPNASHQVGVGCLVVSATNRVLLVQEAVGPTAGRGIWKIPTGLVEAREDLAEAAERELREEVGLRCDFNKVLTIRHSHAAPHGKSDLFFVCLLTPRDESAPLVLDPSEIACAEWADFDAFLAQAPYPRDSPVWKAIYEHAIGAGGRVGAVPGLRREQFHDRRSGRAATVYSTGDTAGPL